MHQHKRSIYVDCRSLLVLTSEVIVLRKPQQGPKRDHYDNYVLILFVQRYLQKLSTWYAHFTMLWSFNIYVINWVNLFFFRKNTTCNSCKSKSVVLIISSHSMAPFGSVSTQPLATRASGIFGMTFMLKQTVVMSLAGHSITKLTCT